MSDRCALCEYEKLNFSESFLGADDLEVKFAVCDCCQSFIPEYVSVFTSEADAISQQVKFHEEWWTESSREELDEVLGNVKDLVGDLGLYLGPTAPENLVLELGSGRGSLLRALLDKGYSAYACEPAPKLVALARKYYGLTEENLFEVPGDYFLDHVVPVLPGRVHAFVLWHVLEHLENPMRLLHKLYGMLNDGGCLILQLPMFCKQYIYPEHYFFPSNATFEYIAKDVGFKIEAVDYDLNNFFVTVCFRKSISTVFRKKNEFDVKVNYMSPLSQAIFFRDQVVHEREMAVIVQADIIDEKIQGMSLMESLIQERGKTIDAQTSIINEKIQGMSLMELLIQEQGRTIEVQAGIIDDKVVGMDTMSTMIDERDSFIAAQAGIISLNASRLDDMNSMLECIAKELDLYKKSFVFKAAKFVGFIK